MAIISNNTVLSGMSGKFGNTCVFRQVRGKTVVAALPSKAKSTSEAQRATRIKFAKATEYAKEQVKSPFMKMKYAARIDKKKHSAYAVAITDYLNAPVIDDINSTAYTGSAGQPIIIHASDDFEVTIVTVTIYDWVGNIIEQGIAKPNEDRLHEYVYLTKVINRSRKGSSMEVQVGDMTGNISKQKVDCESMEVGEALEKRKLQYHIERCLDKRLATPQLQSAQIEWTTIQLYARHFT